MNKYKKVENGLEMPIMTTLHHHQYKAAEQIRKDKEQRLVHLSQNALVKNAVNDKGEYSEENNQKKCREKLNVLLCMWKPYTDLFAPEINLQYVDVNEQNMTPDQKKEQEAHPKKVLTDYEGIKNINISNNIKDFNFTIHLIPHSHQDLGWQLTLSQYYNFKVKYIFKNLWQALSDDPKKTFVMDNIGYLKAYLDDQKNTKEYPQIIKKLQDWLIEGRVEITNISISSPDEAITYYKDLLSNIRSGVHWINTEILKGLDSDQIQKIKNQNFKNAWYIDAFGHSSTTMKLLSQLGYNSVTWARMNTQQLDYRRKNKKLIFDWISETQNKDFQVEDKLRVITFPFHYHTFFSFDVFSPFSLNPMTEEFYLSMQNFKLFAKEMQFLSQEFAGNVAMLPVGEDFAFVNPQPVFTRIEFYIIIIESNKEKKSVMEKCKVQFSTINRFLNDVQQNYNSTWETYKENPKIGGDFLPLKEKENHRSWHDAVWSGYFATRQNFKLKIAEFSRFLNTVTNLYMSRVKFIEKTWEDYKV